MKILYTFSFLSPLLKGAKIRASVALAILQFHMKFPVLCIHIPDIEKKNDEMCLSRLVGTSFLTQYKSAPTYAREYLQTYTFTCGHGSVHRHHTRYGRSLPHRNWSSSLIHFWLLCILLPSKPQLFYLHVHLCITLFYQESCCSINFMRGYCSGLSFCTRPPQARTVICARCHVIQLNSERASFQKPGDSQQPVRRPLCFNPRRKVTLK